jgi:hypothetical protein
MNHQQKIEKLRDIKSEADFRIILIDLLKKMGYSDVKHTHRFGSPELGKDIIGRIVHQIDGDEWHAFVVKHGRIGGGSVEVETIKSQIKQSFEYPYDDLNGNKIRIHKVKVVTNENFTSGAQTSISSSNELKLYPNIDYWYHEKLIPLIDQHYPDYWLPGDEFCKEYSKSVKFRIQEEFELKDLSLNIEDKKVKKLITLFVEPHLTESVIEEFKDKIVGTEKRVSRKKVSIYSLSTDEQNIIVTGEPGSGKTKLINNLTLSLLDADKNAEEKFIPVKLSGRELKEAQFSIEEAVSNSVSLNAVETFSRTDLTQYRKIVLIDGIDVLTKEEKKLLFQNVNEYCVNGSRYIITQRKNDNLDLDSDERNTKTIRLHNFNLKQIEAFIQKYFEGTDRGEKFIQVLRESNLFAKLPTTPLTVTLLSLLYDQHGYEIPATITDIYDDFTQVMLGKLEVRNRAGLLLLHIKKRLFAKQALKMLDSKIFEVTFDEFKININSFLKSKGYIEQTDEEIIELIENSGMLYIDSNNNVGFKQQAFIEYLASVEIYDHSRPTHYEKLLTNFNDVAWQNTAIFFAGRSKDMPHMISDLLEKMPNDDVRDWFINAGGMGYLSQALYMTDNEDRKKLIKKSLDNIVASFYALKEMSKLENHFFSDMPLPLIATMLNSWFIENFKSITLRVALTEVFNELALEYKDADINDFDGDFKLFLIASTLFHKNLNDESAFDKLVDRNSFIKNPVLMIAGDLFLESGEFARKEINDEIKKKIDKQIKHHIKAIQYILREPAYRFNNDYQLMDKAEQKALPEEK